MINPIPLSAVPSWFDRIEGLLAKIAARSHGEYSVDTLWEQLSLGELWLAELDSRAIAIFEGVSYRTGLKKLRVMGLAGDGLRDWQDNVYELDDIARKLGFHRVQVPLGREGWARVGEKYGYKKIGIMLEKDLSQ